MAVDFDDLVDADTEEERLSFLLTTASAEELPTTSWGPFSQALALIRVFAKGLADNVGLVARIARGAVLDLAEKGWLTLLAASAYGLERNPATFGQVRVRLTRTVASGPDTIATNALWLVRSDTGLRYNNIAGGTLGATVSNTLDLTFQAESPGASYNATLGTTVALSTPLVGVSVAVLDLGAGTPTVTTAVNEESDPSLRTRCKARWATIGLQKIADAYAYLAKNVPGFTEVTKVYVDDTNPDGPGTLRTYLATDAGAVAGGTITGVNAYLQDRKSTCSILTVSNATADAVNITAVVYVAGSFLAAAKTAIVAQLQASQAALAIGDGAGAGKVYLTQIIEDLMVPAGVRNVTVAAPSADYTPAKGHIAVLTYTIDTSITFVAV